jgi:hypothetical protein
MLLIFGGRSLAPNCADGRDGGVLQLGVLKPDGLESPLLEAEEDRREQSETDDSVSVSDHALTDSV